MTSTLVEQAARQFLESSKPDVLCIRGKWGVGKTYSWKNWLASAVAAGNVSFKRYAYCSLFGINSLNELKASIVEQTVYLEKSKAVPTASIDTVRDGVKRLLEFGQKSSWSFRHLLTLIPGTGSVTETLPRLLFLSSRDQIVCIDDIERRGAGLDMSDLLGLISFLKEERGCKIVLILNDEKLDEQRKTFDKYLEKVVDKSLVFAPTAKQSADIVFGATPVDQHIVACCLSLDIRNVRVLLRIKEHARFLLPKLSKYDQRSREELLTTLVLLCWCTYIDGAPSTDVLEGLPMREIQAAVRKEALTDEEQYWLAAINKLKFRAFPAIGHALRDGVRNGFFDEAVIEQKIQESESEFQGRDREHAYNDTWELFHGFEIQGSELAEKMAKAFSEAVDRLSAQTLDATVELLKAVDRTDEAHRLIELYVQSKKDNVKAFDPVHHPALRVIDPDVRAAFSTAALNLRTSQTPSTVLEAIANEEFLTDERRVGLLRLRSADFLAFFEKKRPNDVASIVECCAEVSESMRDGTLFDEAAKAVHELLARDKPINQMRLAKSLRIIDTFANAKSHWQP